MHHALGIADDAIVLVKGEVAYAGPGRRSSAICRRACSAASRAPPVTRSTRLAAEQRRVRDARERVERSRRVRCAPGRQRVVVEAFEHRDERRASRSPGRGPAARPRRCGATITPVNCGEQVGAEPPELAAADLGLGPGRGSPGRSARRPRRTRRSSAAARSRPVGAGFERLAAPRRAPASPRRPPPRARGRAPPCWRSRGRRCRARSAASFTMSSTRVAW